MPNRVSTNNKIKSGSEVNKFPFSGFPSTRFENAEREIICKIFFSDVDKNSKIFAYSKERIFKHENGGNQDEINKLFLS